MRPNMPKMRNLLNQVSAERTRFQSEPIWASKIDLEYTYGQLKIFEETSKHCNFAIIRGTMNGYYRYKKRFYGLSDIPTIIHEKVDGTINYQTPVWLDDIIIVTRGDKKTPRKIFQKT